MPRVPVGHNLLLEALPSADWEAMHPFMTRQPMHLDSVLYEPGQLSNSYHFPLGGAVSLVYELSDGNSVEIAVIGNEGMIGLPLFLGDGRSPHRAIVQMEGEMMTISHADMTGLFPPDSLMHWMLARYSQAQSIQMSQTAVCNRHHCIEEQLCRWLLMSIDRLQDTQLVITQESIAQMLGVRRAGVTETAGKLKSEGLISYRRGQIAVLDREKLEARVCECYLVVRNEYRRLLAFPPRESSAAHPSNLHSAEATG